MAAEDQETFGRTVVRGMAWGLGFAIVSVPVTMLIRHVLEDDEEETAPWRALGMSRVEYLDLLDERAEERVLERMREAED